MAWWKDKDEKGAFAATWISLHAIADAFPLVPTPEDKAYAKQYMSHLSHLLPCNQCNLHLQLELASFPVQCESGPEFSRYMWELHNRVNARLGKPGLSWEESQHMQQLARQVHWSKVLEWVPFLPPPPILGGLWSQHAQQQAQHWVPMATGIAVAAALGVGLWWMVRNRTNREASAFAH